MKRRLVALGSASALVVAHSLVTVVVAMADVPAAYVSYSYGTGVHTIGSTTAFPNFNNGAINNHYPLAQVQQDGSPSSTAVATYSDSGPLTATAGSQYNQGCSAGNPPPPPSACQNPNNQVPYATSRYPGGPSNAHVDSCTPSYAAQQQQNPCPSGQAASRADSVALQLSADASGFYAGGGAQPFSGASGESHTVVGADGSLIVTTHSEVQNFAFGVVRVSKVVVDTVSTSDAATGSADAHVVVGQVTVNGQPVVVNDQGLTVQQKQPLPCPSPPVAPAPAAPSPPAAPGGLPLPGTAPSGGSSSSSGGGCVPAFDVTYIKLFTVQPTKTVSGNHATSSASGLHIVITHPSPGPGVPQQSVEYVLGEGYADASVGGGSGGAGFFSGGFPGGDFGPGGFGDGGFGAPDAGGAASAFNNAGHALLTNWRPLALMFLTLEALVVAAASAWVWARNAPGEEVLNEVLAP
jgi:hypothetical protein